MKWKRRLNKKRYAAQLWVSERKEFLFCVGAGLLLGLMVGAQF
jgi:hypothetical protein